MIISTPDLVKSFQSLIFLGLPLRTKNTTVEVYGAELLGNCFCQFLWISPALTISSISLAKARVTTSACKPSITERACLPEPPCDCLKSTSCPVRCFQNVPKA